MLRDGPVLVLGGGSNLLFAGDPQGVVLALTAQSIALVEDDGDTAIVRADAATKTAAGATLVQLYTGLVYCGPALVKDCVDALRRRKEAPSRGNLPPHD
jgi:UDP-N-acetylenolpyruvoylglucosamine reductase